MATKLLKLVSDTVERRDDDLHFGRDLGNKAA